jgi:hypothetical protein
MGFARTLAVLDDASADDARRLRTFETIFILAIGVEYWFRALPRLGDTSLEYRAHLTIASLCCLLALHVPWRRAALAMLALSHAILAWQSFPSTGNHVYLEAALCALGATLRTDDAAERAVYYRAVRWLVIVVLFWSGLQKLVHGYWVHGQYLAFALSRSTFRPVLGVLAGQDELARLTRFSGAIGDGPYLVRSWTLLAASNVVWIAELLLAPLLLWPRTRRGAAIAALALVALVELGAREAFFGLVFANAALLYLSAAVHRRAIAAVTVILVAILLSRLGVIPGVTFY